MEHRIPPEANADLLRIWKWCAVVGRKFTIREALWVARLRDMVDFEWLLQRAVEYAIREKACEVLDAFLKRIGMWLSLEGLGVPEAAVVSIADHSQVLPGYRYNPRVATRDEILQMLESSYRR